MCHLGMGYAQILSIDNWVHGIVETGLFQTSLYNQKHVRKTRNLAKYRVSESAATSNQYLTKTSW